MLYPAVHPHTQQFSLLGSDNPALQVRGSNLFARAPQPVGMCLQNKSARIHCQALQHCHMRLLLQIAPRAYRVSASTIRFFSNSVDLVQSGVFGTLNWRGSFVRDGKAISPWHDLSIKPLGGPAGFYTYVNEIPAGSFEKIEVSTDEAWNPLKQDAKKGKPRLYGLRTKFNYGCFPQTWENPWRHSQRIAAVGDGDPLDAVELGWLGGGLGPLPLGSVSSVRVLGCLALIDEGEVDWKVIVARQEHPLSLTTGNVDLQLIAPDIVNDVREWFRTYKTFEGKGLNEFGFGGRCLTSVEAEEVIAETQGDWAELMHGKVPPKHYWIGSNSSKSE